MLSAQIERSFETANLMDVPKLASPARAYADAGSTIGTGQDEHQPDHRKFS